MGAGDWLVGRAQPVAFASSMRRVRRRGWMVRDRSHLERVATSGESVCAAADRPFLTHIPCASPVSAVSCKVLLAPAAAWAGADTLRPVPMSARGSICVSRFALSGEPQPSWVVMATASRTRRMAIDEGQTLCVRPDALVAWTGNQPTGFCPKLGLLDLILPRGPKDLLFSFYGPGVVWVEGSRGGAGRSMRERRGW